jgi:hypothetical protein
VAAGPHQPEAVEAFFAGCPLGLAAYHRVRAIVDPLGPASVRVTKSQVAFRRRRGFAWLWLPGRWLPKPGAEVVLSIGLDRHATSDRFKEVAHPAPRVWIHHLELRAPDEIDNDVAGWLREAYERRG